MDQWTNKIPMDIFRSIGYSIRPLDPMDTQKSNGQLEIHLTNGIVQWPFVFSIGHLAWVLDINQRSGMHSVNTLVFYFGVKINPV
jgi:hypothetical protein